MRAFVQSPPIQRSVSCNLLPISVVSLVCRQKAPFWQIMNRGPRCSIQISSSVNDGASFSAQEVTSKNDLDVQKFLRQSPSAEQGLESLKKKYKIVAKLHKTYPNLVLLKYDHIESPMAEDIVHDCRGIILDKKDNWNVVSMAFRKFFNYQEGDSDAHIDWSSAEVQEKVDGSITVMYAYDGKWHVSTSGSPDSTTPLQKNLTFADLFWECFRQQKMVLPPPDCRKSFIFEMTSPKNKIVIVPDADKLTVLGSRCLRTFKEETASKTAEFLGSPSSAVKCFPFKSFEEILATFERMDPFQQEGYVVVDGEGNRVKAKHPGYVAWQYANGNRRTEHHFVDIARQKETSEVIATLPEYKERVMKVYTKFEEFVQKLEAEYGLLKDIKDDNEFRLKAEETQCPPAMHHLHSQSSVTLRHFLRKMDLDELTLALGYEGWRKKIDQDALGARRFGKSSKKSKQDRSVTVAGASTNQSL